MYKVLIVDDAIWVCQLIKKLVRWDELGLEVIGMVNDGVTALDVILNQKPDLVITDIRMPGIDGLTLIEKVIENGVYTNYIIISGYQDFNYAQKAIRFGVKNYLLKPIDKDELNSTLENVVLGLNKEKEQLLQKNNIAKKLVDKENKLHEEILQNIFSSLYKVSSIEDINNEYGFGFKEGAYQVIGFSFHSKLKNINKNKEIIEWIKKLFDKQMKALLFKYYFVNYDENLFILLNYAKSEDKDVYNKLEKIFNELLLKKTSFRSDFTLGIGKPVDTINNIKESYDTAVQSINSKVVIGLNKIIYIKKANYSINNISQIITSEEQKKIYLYLESINYIKTSKWIEDVFDVIENGENVYPGLVYDVCNEILVISNKIYKNVCKKDLDVQSINKKLFKSIDLSELKHELLNYIKKLLQEIKATGINKNRKTIEIAKEFIIENYNKDISLNEIAKKVFLNTTYLSELFKKEEGINISEYIINYRIEMAKEFLKDIQYKIQDVSIMVGYNNPKYFSQLFKNRVGLTPAEFRKIFM